MNDFFEPPPRLEQEPEPAYEWEGPPEAVVPATVPVEPLMAALEASRDELASRMRQARLPTTVSVSRLVVHDHPDGDGYSSEREEITVNGLRDPAVDLALRRLGRPTDAWGLHHHFEEIASRLAVETDLGSRSSPLWPSEKGAGAIMDRFLLPLAGHYLRQLEDVAVPDRRILDSVLSEFTVFCEAKHAVVIEQIALTGLRTEKSLTHRGITLRPLTPAERGSIAAADVAPMERRATSTTDLVVPTAFNFQIPAVVLELTSERDWGWQGQPHSSTLPQRVILAFFLLGYQVGTRGAIATLARPSWSGLGTSSQPFPVGEGRVAPSRLIDVKDFERVVDLALRIPEFGGEEGDPHEVALYRVFRGCSVSGGESGFLDFAIALEAALLSQTRDELAYKFRLYGSLYLKDRRPAEVTFQELKSIYEARSKLVHGGKLRVSERHIVEASAGDLARAVVLKAIEAGRWPVPAELDRAAIGDA